ncbi:MAG: hypothetical protein ABEH40_09020 [Haloferacaceae archaeon]
MAGRDRRRLLLVALALAALAAMMVHYPAAEPRYGPTEAALATDYGAHVGERVTFWTTVVAVRGVGFEVRAGGGLTVVGSDAAVRPGDSVAVHGTLRPNRRLAAERVLVSPVERRLYMFGVSLVAVGIALGAFLRRWRPDRRRLAFVPRDRPRPRPRARAADGDDAGAPDGGDPGGEGRRER